MQPWLHTCKYISIQLALTTTKMYPNTSAVIPIFNGYCPFFSSFGAVKIEVQNWLNLFFFDYFGHATTLKLHFLHEISGFPRDTSA